MPIAGNKAVLSSNDSLLTFFETAVLSNPSSVAVYDVINDNALTFLQLSNQANKLARHLLRILNKPKESNSESLKEDRIVAVCIPPTTDLIVALIAILKAGGAYLPLDIEFPSSRVNHILQDAKPKILIRGKVPSAVNHLKDDLVGGLHVIDLLTYEKEIDLESEHGISKDELGVKSSSGELAAVLYTSGSTGTPKGVRIPHSAVLNRLIWQWKTFPYEANEVCCFKTALTFVDSISEIFGPLLTGHQVVILPKSMTKEVEKMVNVLEKFKIRRLVLVPSLLRSILLDCSRRNNPTLDNLKLWICSGEVLSQDLLFSFFKTFKNGQVMCNFYGSTEVMGDVTHVEFTSSEDVLNSVLENKVPIGAPISNCIIYLVNEKLEEVPEGNVGEILVAGLNLASGYIGGTQNKFLPNPFTSQKGYNMVYRTGDFGRYVNGQIYYEGRTDSQLKIRGHRVDLSEVQTAVQSINGVQKCCVLCYKPGEVDQVLLAFYSTCNSDVTKEYMIGHISSLLPQYMHPQFVIMEDLPLLVNGKIDRQRLLRQYDESFKNSSTEIEKDLSNYQNVNTKMAETLLRTVARVLGPSAPSKISLDQNFFEIGGNSLNSILAITTFQDNGYHIGITEFLKAKTLLDVVRHSVKSEETFIEYQRKISKFNGGNEHLEYKILPLKLEFKDDVIRLLTKSFVHKGDLELLLQVEEQEYTDLIEVLWPFYVQQGLSYVVCRNNPVQEILAASINNDWNVKPDVKFISKNLQYIFDFLNDCQSKANICWPKQVGKVLRSSFIGTRDDISSKENVSLILLMEEESHRMAKRKGFEILFATNSSSFTQHISEELLGYKIVASSAFNTWVAKDGVRPFQAASDNQMAVCSVCFIPPGTE